MAIRVVRVTDPVDREKVFRFLYELWSGEFERSMSGMDHERGRMMDELDAAARHFAALDEAGRIVGCIRTNIFSEGGLHGDLAAWMRASDLTELLGAERVGFTSHLAVAPHVRGRTVASQLVAAVLRTQVSLRMAVDLSYCQLNLLHMYFQLGSRPYAANFRLPGAGVRVPLAFMTQDVDYLREVESPLLPMIPRDFGDGGKSARLMATRFRDFKSPGFDRATTQAVWARLAYTSPGGDEVEGRGLLTGFSAEELQSLMERVTMATFKKGEQIYRQGETEPGMGVVLSGCLGASVGEGAHQRYVGVLQPGDPFGELHGLGTGRRTADVVALDRTEVLLLPPHLLDDLAKTDPAKGLRLAHNLLRVLAIRLDRTNKLVAAGEPSSDLEKRLRRPEATIDAELTSGESYRFSTFDDTDEELERLSIQASLAEDFEFSMLESAGLHDGLKILDIGSGPGVISGLMAKRYPSSLLIGVEPDASLRGSAQEYASQHGVADRCMFVDGTAEKIPLEDAGVDFTYARLLLQHLPTRAKALVEMKRVTRPGGVVCVLDADDGTILIHPEVDGWMELERMCYDAQALSGGDRRVGRSLLGLMRSAGLVDVRVIPVPVTIHELGREGFFRIVFGFKKQLLVRAGNWNDETAGRFEAIRQRILEPDTFAMTVVMIAHGLRP